MSCRCFFLQKRPPRLLWDNFEATYMLLNYCTNTVANINILYMNFIRCDVLVACPHRKLEMGSAIAWTTKPNLSDCGAWTPSNGVPTSGDSLSPLYPKPVPLVKIRLYVCLSVCRFGSFSNLHKFSTYTKFLYIYVNLWRERPNLRT